MEEVKPYPGMVITKDVRFAAGEYDFSEREGILIVADHITIDGNGAVLHGGCLKTQKGEASHGEAFSYAPRSGADSGPSLGFFGTGIAIKGRTGVTVKNLKADGFDQGLYLESCRRMTIENCDFSDCFHDPAWGWEEHGFHGGILILDTCESRIFRCKANRVWDALNLRHSHDNVIEENDFSHTSDTALKLWHSCRNRVLRNDFSYGIRIDPGEVHARDSSGVLIESGSDNNYFLENDMTHGGDGLFIRVLNGWMSCGNVFEKNDCSYANNNAIEAWADHNTYIGNIANHSSYGFWLGNSDYILLKDNEAGYNGRLNHNAPESFGNAGIAVVNGSGSHSVLSGNYVHDNTGPGIALRNSRETPSSHWILEDNRIENNQSSGGYRGHGIYLNHVRNVTLSGNTFTGNEGDEVYQDDDVSDVFILEGGKKPGPVEIAPLPERIRANEAVKLEGISSENLRWRWDFGDQTVSTEQNPVHRWREPGMYPLSVTADNGVSASLSGKTVFVLPEDYEPFGVTQAKAQTGVLKRQPLTVDAEDMLENIVLLEGRMEVKDSLVMRLIFHSDADTDWEKRTRYPVVTLMETKEDGVILTPTEPMLEMLYAPRSEQRGEGRLYQIPLTGNGQFEATVIGKGLKGVVREIKIRYGGLSKAHTSLTIGEIGMASLL